MLVSEDKCNFCGQKHPGICEDVKAIEYYPDGSIKRVEFKTPADRIYQTRSPLDPPWIVTC